MKILIIANKMPYPMKDGGAIATMSLALSLQNSGNTVDLLAINTSKHYFDCKNIPEEIKARINIYDIYVNTKISLYKACLNLFLSSKPYNAERFVSKDFANKLSQLLKENEYDIVQIEGLYMCEYIDVIRNNSNAKIAFRPHNVEHEIWKRTARAERNVLKRKYKKILAERIKKLKDSYINKYDYLIPLSEKDAEFFSKIGNSKPVFIANVGMDSQSQFFLDTNDISSFPKVFHLGALDWIPNREGLIWFVENVWKDFVKKYPDAKFYVAGRNAPNSFKEYLVKQKLIYLGEIESAFDFMKSVTIMVVPLLSGSGVRVKIVEGMAAGKAIITTSVGVEGINATNNDNILVADDKKTFFSQLEKVYNDRDCFETISENARQFIKNELDNDVIAKKLSDFYITNINKQ